MKNYIFECDWLIKLSDNKLSNNKLSNNNLRDSLVRSYLNDTTASAHTNASPTINTPGGHITINSKYTCTSNNVVYLIKCRTCNKVYIGETGRRLGDRFREHLGLL